MVFRVLPLCICIILIYIICNEHIYRYIFIMEGIQWESLQVRITVMHSYQSMNVLMLALYSTLNLEQSELHCKPVAIGRCKIKWLNEPKKLKNAQENFKKSY